MSVNACTNRWRSGLLLLYIRWFYAFCGYGKRRLTLDDVVERVIRFTTRRIHQAQVGDGIDLFQQQRIVQL